jgi:transposase
LPEHLPRERVAILAPSACVCCGGRLSKLGEDITETLEVIPRQWKVIQTVRERFSCRACETITQPPAPFHPIARGRAGPQLLAMILEAKFSQHLPLNRLSETYAREGIELSVSTIADWVGTCTATLTPLMTLIDAHVLAAERLHGDDTTVPVLARGRTITGRLWTYVRDDRPFAGPEPPAAMFRYSRDRTAGHPQRHLTGYAGILQADAYAGFNELYAPERKPGPICLTNNAAERELRGVALGRKAWMFAGSDRGGERAARHVLPHRYRQAERRRSPRPARRRARQDRRPPGLASARAATLELEGSPGHAHRQGRLIMAAPSAVFTIARAAEMLGETVELLDQIADQLEPEDGCLWIYDTSERATLGFTLRGIESLKELIADQKR